MTWLAAHSDLFWPIAMLVMLPVLAMGERRRIKGVPVPWGPLARTWLALFAAAFLGQFIAFDNVRAFAVLDALVAVAVLTSPRGEAQRLIGFVSGCAVLFHAFFYFATIGRLQPGPVDFNGYADFNRFLGWVQLAALLTGGGHAAYRSIVSRAYDRSRGGHFRVGASQ